MSRVGKQPIALPEGVSVAVQKDCIEVKGPRGALRQQVDKSIQVEVQEAQLVLTRATNAKRHRAYHGLYRSLLNNMVLGVSKGFVRELELVGVGYKASSSGQVLELSLGFAHPIFMRLPDEVRVTTETPKGRAGTSHPKIRLESADKQLVGQVAAKIRALRKVEPYKGKGVRFVGEVIRRKAGKAAKKA